MKLGIVIPFKSKQVSNSWSTTCDALWHTLQTIIKQSNQSFSVAVVGHEKPDFFDRIAQDNIQFVTVDAPAPDRSSANFSHRDYLDDKSLKIATGIKLLKSQDIDYWYQLDADDLMALNFVDTISKQPKASGYIINHGYILYKNRGRVIANDDLILYCGSTSIIADAHMPTPTDFSTTGVNIIPWCRYPHMTFDQFFIQELDDPALVINDRLLCYVLGSGDNISDAWRDNWWKKLKAYLKPIIKGQRISKELQQQFLL